MSGQVTAGSDPSIARAGARDGSLRILAVGNMYPPHHTGGYELMWEAVMRAARTAGHETRVLTSDHREDPGLTETEADVHRVLRWYWDLERYEFPRLSPLERLAIERHNASLLDRHLVEFAPDIVTWWSMGCMSLSLIERVRRARLPAVFVVHDDWVAYGPQHDQWIRMWRGIRRAAGPIAEALFRIPTTLDLSAAGPFVFNSRYTMDRARDAGLQAPQTTVVHPGIDERFLEPAPKESWSWRLAYFGRIDRQKGIDTALRALKWLPARTTLEVWGTGDDGYVADMRRLAGELGAADRVRFPGWIDADGLRDAYSRADVVVFPVRWKEPFGLVPLEAMGIGRPVVSTRQGGTAEFIRHEENALVFEADDSRALAQAVRRLAEDEALRERLVEAGRNTAAAYTLSHFAQRTLQEIVRAALPEC